MALKPVTVIIATISLIIVGLVIVRNADAYAVNCLCVEGQPCQCENFVRDAVMTVGFLTIAAGATLPVLALIAARKKGRTTEISE